MDEIHEGQIVKAEFLSGPARVLSCEDRDSHVLFRAVIVDDSKFVEKRLSQDQARQIEVVEGDSLTRKDDPESFFRLIEANRIRLAHRFDPMLAVSTSQIDPLPHQMEAVYNFALQTPRLRFMIADDPGAGKTIMAGLIIKEMKFRGLTNRILVVAPGHLKYQWQREMKERFGEGFRLIDRNTMRSAWGENVWEETNHAIASVDFLKQDDIKATLNSAQWDLVIVDEAHKMSAYAYVTQEQTKIDKTQRYQLGEVLSSRTEHMLFLTATPHRGDEENFRLLLDLLRPGFFANTEILQESVERGENPVFIRRLKEDMVDFEGKNLFPPRNVQTVKFRLTEPEKTLYNEVTRYVQNYYDQAKENRHITFAMVILQRRLTSSTQAILSSLQRRRSKLEELLRLPDKIKDNEQYEGLRKYSEEDLEELSEDERWEIEERLEHLTIANNIEDVEREIEEVERLITLAKDVRAQEVESKLTKLKDEILNELGDRKLLIFTEHKDTLWYLIEKLEQWGYEVNTIHGGMTLDQRVEAERVFREETQIMVATEAAGEGINLQFCSLMVNYDIPWNPNRLEQRMGRVHRYGQKHEVFVWNLISRDTREGELLDKLFKKLARMRTDLGSDRVYDIIGEVIPGTNFGELLKESIFEQRRMEDIEQALDEIDTQRGQELLEVVSQKALATRNLDLRELQREKLEAEEHRLVPEYVQDFFLRGFDHFGGKISKSKHGYRITSVPFELRKYGKEYGFKTRYGKVQRQYRRVTFDKKVAQEHAEYEFVAPGHPLLEALNEAIFDTDGAAKAPFATYWDPTGGRDGVLWFFEAAVVDGQGDDAGRRIFCIRQYPTKDARDNFERVDPSILWDLAPAKNHDLPEWHQECLRDDTAFDQHVDDVLMEYREELEERRQRQCDIKERYGLKSLEFLIQDSNQKLLEYESRAAEGDSMDIVIRNERRNLEELERRKEKLQKEIRLERNLTIEQPKVLGAAVVLDKQTYEATESEATSSDPSLEENSYVEAVDQDAKEEIELVGMEVATEHEKSQGREVTDVSKESHGGFDLRSLGYDEHGRAQPRYIEVKARAQSGAVRITANEWKKARMFGDDYWLYVVTEASTNSPVLTRIQNPASVFAEGEDIYATGYIIDETVWRQRADVDDSRPQGE